MVEQQLYAGTNSIFTLRPKARAALPSVFRVTEELDASSNRSTAARLVFIRAAICVLVNSFSFKRLIQLEAQRLLQRAGLDFAQNALFLQEIPEVTATMIFFAHIFCRYCSFTFLRQIQFVWWRLLLFLDEAVQQDNFLIHHREQRSCDAVVQP